MKYILLLLITSIFCACGGKDLLKPSEYSQWMQNPENGMKQSKKIQDFEFIAQYKTPEYITVLEEKSNALKAQLVSNRVGELGSDMAYFNFRIKGNAYPLQQGTTSEMEFNQRMAYANFGMQQDLELVEGGDTLDCVMYQFVRNYNIAPYIDFVVGFERNNQEHIEADKTLIFNDNVFGVGKVKLHFSASDLNQIPKLKTL